MHALIIEDMGLMSLLIEDMLGDFGYTSFDIVANQVEAIAAALRRCPDLIVADIRLNAGNGIDAVRTICADSPIATVFVTGDTARARQLDDADIMVPKPFSTGMLHEAIVDAVAAHGVAVSAAGRSPA